MPDRPGAADEVRPVDPEAVEGDAAGVLAGGDESLIRASAVEPGAADGSLRAASRPVDVPTIDRHAARGASGRNELADRCAAVGPGASD
jgi:hypothetical protein